MKKAIEEHRMIPDGGKVIVAASGGKDSTTLMHVLNSMGHKPEALHIDLSIGSYSDTNLSNLRRFCSSEDIRLNVVSIRDMIGTRVCYIRSLLKEAGNSMSSCAICGVLKRSILNREARRMGGSVLAVGHNLDDEAQTALMNFLNGTISMGQNSGPVLRGPGRGFVPRVKPLFFTPEAEIREYSQSMGFPVLYDKCPCSLDTQRAFLRDFLNRVEDRFPGTKLRIVKNFSSMQPLLSKALDRGDVMECGSCGEPSVKEVCNACAILGSVNKHAAEPGI